MLFHFFMRRVLPALATELAEFQTLGRGLLVLGRRVVPVLTLTALQCNNFTHKLFSQLLLSNYFVIPTGAASFAAERRDIGLFFLRQDLADRSRAYGPAAFTDREAQSLLHRHRGNQLNRQR